MNVLAIGAHPDDIELGCFGTLARHYQKGNKIYGVVMTNGELGGNPTIRKKESRSSANLLKMKLFFGNFPDGKLKDDINTINFIEKIINKHSIDVIYTPTEHDRHQDHRNLAKATISASRFVDEVYSYESPSSLTSFSPQMFVDITKSIETKKKALSLQKTQIEKYYMEIASSEGLSKYRAFQSGQKSEYCEAFEVIRLVKSID